MKKQERGLDRETWEKGEDWGRPYAGNSSRHCACNSAQCSRALDSDFDDSRIQSQGNHFLSTVIPTGYEEWPAHWGFPRDYAHFSVNTCRLGPASRYRSIIFRESLDAEASEGQVAETEESRTTNLDLELSGLQSHFEPAKTPQTPSGNGDGL